MMALQATYVTGLTKITEKARKELLELTACPQEENTLGALWASALA